MNVDQGPDGLNIIGTCNERIQGKAQKHYATYNGDGAHWDFGSNHASTDHSQTSANGMTNNTASNHAIVILQKKGKISISKQ